MSRFINDDVIYCHPVVAAQISPEEFKRELCEEVLRKLGEEDYAELDFEKEAKRCPEDPLPYGRAISLLMCHDYKRPDDDMLIPWEYRFGDENIDFSRDWGKDTEIANQYLGIHTLGKLTFCGMEVGGDWEVPIFMMLYWDGTAIKLYIPRRGNTFNADALCGLGSEGDVFGDYSTELSRIGEIALESYAKLGIKPTPDEDEDEDGFYINWGDLYAKKYGFKDQDDVEICWDAIRQEIYANFRIRTQEEN